MNLEAERVVETLGEATEENQMSSLRRQKVLTLPAEGEVWMTGDLHDHRRNFERLLSACDLADNPQRHLILHELIHGERTDDKGADTSWTTLYKAAELKCDFPEQVHFLLANHDLAQIQGEGIMKGGASVCESFSAGVKNQFGPDGDRVDVAIREFLLSLPLAIRTEAGMFFSHSLPTDSQIEKYDYSVFDRELTGPDFARRTGPVYQLIWGRGVTPAGVAAFAEKMNAKTIVTGHQPQEMGYAVNGPQHLIIASDHNQGCFLPIDLAQAYDAEALVERLIKFVSIE